MSVVQLPVGRATPERLASRRAVPVSSRLAAALQLVQRQSPASAYCAACSAPIDFGAVRRGEEAYCSVECAEGGNRLA